MNKITCIITGLAVVLVFSGIPLYASHEAVAKDKGQLREVVFIHHQLPDNLAFGKPSNPGKPENPGKPDKPPKPTKPQCTITENDNINDWGVIGWHMPSSGLTYQINFDTVPNNLPDNDFKNAIAVATNTWEQTDNGINWSDGGSTNIKRLQYDGVNLVAFGNAQGGIAVARIWYWTDTLEVAESDIIFSKRLDWSITDPSAGDCAGAEGTFDVQGIATHEFGHQVGLLDLYDSVDKDLTMYGYGIEQELKKSSLGTGDINGAQTITP